MRIECWVDNELKFIWKVALKADTKRFTWWEDKAKARDLEVQNCLKTVQEQIQPIIQDYEGTTKIEYVIIHESKINKHV